MRPKNKTPPFLHITSVWRCACVRCVYSSVHVLNARKMHDKCSWNGVYYYVPRATRWYSTYIWAPICILWSSNRKDTYLIIKNNLHGIRITPHTQLIAYSVHKQTCSFACRRSLMRWQTSKKLFIFLAIGIDFCFARNTICKINAARKWNSQPHTHHI